MALGRLRKRSEFLRLRGGFRAASAACVIEAKPREQLARVGRETDRGEADPCSEPRAPASDISRFGYTVTKKLGGAVVRNRIRRRLKAAIALCGPELAIPGHDYVVVARSAAHDMAWDELQAQIAQNLRRIERLSKSAAMPARQRK